MNTLNTRTEHFGVFSRVFRRDPPSDKRRRLDLNQIDLTSDLSRPYIEDGACQMGLQTTNSLLCINMTLITHITFILLGTWTSIDVFGLRSNSFFVAEKVRSSINCN